MLNFVFLTAALSTASLNCFKSTGIVFSVSIYKSSTFVSKLFKLFGRLISLLMSSLSTSAFEAMSVACSNSFLVV